MKNAEIFANLGLAIDHPSRMGNDWRFGTIKDVPPSLREWAQEQLVQTMRESNSAAYIFVKDY